MKEEIVLFPHNPYPFVEFFQKALIALNFLPFVRAF